MNRIPFFIPLFFFACINALFSQDPGSIDLSYNVGTGPGFTVVTLTTQPDGKVLLGGALLKFNGIDMPRVGRLNTDGSVDTTFKVGKGASTNVSKVIVQPDGKILVIGIFYYFNNVQRNFIVRLHADGSLDTSFNANANADNYINTAALQPDGKIILGGSFTDFSNVSRRNLVRLHPNGKVDSSFIPPFHDPINVLAIQPDGKVITGSSISDPLYPRNFMTRLLPDGTKDPEFNEGKKIVGLLDHIALQNDGRILLSGGITPDKPSNLLVRLLENGDVDSTFSLGAETKGRITSFALQPDNKIIIAGEFLLKDETKERSYLRLNSNGSVDQSFLPSNFDKGSWATSTTLQSDGKIIVVGSYAGPNGEADFFLYRLYGGEAITAVQPTEQPGLSKFSPNPVIDILSVDGEALVYDPMGMLVVKGAGKISMGHLPAGCYLVKQEHSFFKVIKE